jgi:capsule biosynthesis phosphatase
MKVAKSQGFVIEIFTARRMLTHKSNVQSIEEDVGDITRQWLDKYEVPYDRLMFGKPYAQYYVDDKAMRPDEFVSMINE